MEIIIICFLLLLGILLVLAEIFLLPGITIAAIGGAVFYTGGIYYAYSVLGAKGGTITLVVSVACFFAVFFWLLKSRAIDKISLKTDINSTVANEKEVRTINPGDTGITLSRLAPVGKVKVNGITIEAKTTGDFLDEEVEITVLKVFPTQVIVEPKNII